MCGNGPTALVDRIVCRLADQHTILTDQQMPAFS